MDSQRFDGLVRGLASGASRRTILKGLVGGALGMGAVAGRSSGVVRAQCEHCPNGTGCFPDNPQGDCCPTGQALCCSVCVPFGPDVTAENCTGDACVEQGCTTNDDCEAGTCCCEDGSCAVDCCLPAGCTSNDDCESGTCCCEDGSCAAACCPPTGCTTNEECDAGACCCEDGSCAAECCPPAGCPGETIACEDPTLGDICCPAGTGCFPENPLTVCCPAEQSLCCGVCVPFGPDVIAENCTGDACVEQGCTTNRDCESGTCCCADGSCAATCCPPAGCTSNDDCKAGTCCCADGGCADVCCAPSGGGEAPTGTGEALTGTGDTITFPSTGVGVSARETGNSWLSGAAALGGLTALVMSKTLRRDRQAS